MERHLQSVVTPVVSTVLKSPLHTLLDHRTLLLSVTGRKTGHVYAIPVNFARRQGKLIVMSNRERRWWRNLTEPARVTVHIDGHDVSGSAVVLRLDETETVRVLRDYWQRAFDHQLCSERALAIAPEKVLIEITLDPVPGSPVA